MPPSEFDTTLNAPAIVHRYGAASQAIVRATPVETPVNIFYAPIGYAVMMATPADLEDFAVGFSLTEGVVENAAEIRGIAVEPEERGVKLVITLTSEKMTRHLARARNMAGRTGCGVCGIEDFSALPSSKPKIHSGAPFRLSSVRRAVAALSTHQPLNDATHAVHGAAWSDANGAILAAREDVGRHNALDKLIGALARAGTQPGDGFIVITSRCSFEMVEKAAAFGARAIVAISAPTSLAIERAQRHGIILLAIARGDGVSCFAGAERVIDDLAQHEELRP